MFENMFNVEALFKTLPLMAKGMAGIFIVTGVMILSMILLNKLTSKKADK